MERDWSLRGLVALITGGSRGIGKALAETLAREGVKLVLSASSKKNLDSVRESIFGEGGTVETLVSDLTDLTQVHRLAREAPQVYGNLDILVNNAGTAVNRPFAETTDEEWERCLRVNATAPFILCRDLLPHLRRSPRASIINIGSVVGIKGYRNQAAYGASKHALMGFTKVLAREVQEFGVRVHAINPGGVDTDMVAQMRPDLDRSGLIRPDEIARLVVFLLKNRGNAVIDDLHPRRATGEPWY